MNRTIIFPSILCAVLLVFVGCKEKTQKQSAEKKTSAEAPSNARVETTLFDKPLSEIVTNINGRWELVSGQNARELNEFENTFVIFDSDTYIWIEDDKPELGALNWRKADTGSGYEAFVMDVFYAERPSYPLAIKGDTLFIQDCSETAYRYKLVRR